MNSDHLTFDLPRNVLYGFLLLGLAFYWARLARDNRARWTKLYSVIPRSFENTPSPIDRVSIGCWGWITGHFFGILSTLMFIIALDLIFFDGQIVLARRDVIFQQVGNLLGEVWRIFVMLLRALLAGVES
jgi:hypothetical protein